MLKKFLLLLLIINLNNCGYTPVYKQNNNLNFKISTLKLEGDRKINNYFKSKFSRYKNIDSNEHLALDIYTTYTKKIVSKDSTGEASIYDLELNVTINVNKINTEGLKNFEPFSKSYNFKETFLLERNSDKFEENNYENSIKENLANTIFDKFILSITNR